MSTYSRCWFTSQMTRLAPSLIHCTTDRATSRYSRSWFTCQKTRLVASLIHRTTDRATSPYSRCLFTSQKTRLAASLIHRTTGRSHYTAAVLSAVSRLWTTRTSLGVAESQDVVWTQSSALSALVFSFHFLQSSVSVRERYSLVYVLCNSSWLSFTHQNTHTLSGHRVASANCLPYPFWNNFVARFTVQMLTQQKPQKCYCFIFYRVYFCYISWQQ